MQLVFPISIGLSRDYDAVDFPYYISAAIQILQSNSIYSAYSAGRSQNILSNFGRGPWHNAGIIYGANNRPNHTQTPALIVPRKPTKVNCFGTSRNNIHEKPAYTECLPFRSRHPHQKFVLQTMRSEIRSTISWWFNESRVSPQQNCQSLCRTLNCVTRPLIIYYNWDTIRTRNQLTN